jgi:hypothetical protein
VNRDEDVAGLRGELARLRAEVARLAGRTPPSDDGGAATTDRDQLRRVPLRDVLPLRQHLAYITFQAGEWNDALEQAHALGFVLLLLEANGKVAAAYRRPEPGDEGSGSVLL